MVRHRGFTLIELLVVIAIIGTLASVILASLSTAREKARDATRKAQLAEVAKALEMYYDDHGTYQVAGSGSGGSGVGWLDYNYGYPSVAQKLASDGYIGGVVTDPSGVTTGNVNGRTGYMIYATANNYTLWANLERPTTADIATQNNCALSNYDNYNSSYPASAKTNYCISN